MKRNDSVNVTSAAACANLFDRLAEAHAKFGNMAAAESARRAADKARRIAGQTEPKGK